VVESHTGHFLGPILARESKTAEPVVVKKRKRA